MDALFRKSDRLLANTSTEIIRDKMDEIHWNARLISIMYNPQNEMFGHFQTKRPSPQNEMSS